MSIRAKIVHISDLHFGWQYWPVFFSKELADHLVDHVSSQQPDLIICTGDVINSPIALRGLYRARDFLKRLREACKCDLLLVPGNHDCALFGILGIKYLTSLPFRHFMAPFLRLDEPYYSERLNVVVFGLDSNPAIANFARGDVSDADIKKLSHTAQILRTKHGTKISTAFKIAALHHHPTPIPYSGSDVLLVLNNAGSLLVELAKHGIDLVLHGHKHFSAFSKISFLHDGVDYEIPVLAAGSATKIRDHEPRGNSYNLITMFNDDTIEAQTFFAYSRGTFLAGQDSTFTCQSSETASKKKFFAARENSRRHIESLRFHVNVNEFGDAFFSVSLDRLKVSEGATLSGLKLRQRAEFGYFRDFELETDATMIGLAGSVANTTYRRDQDAKTGVTWTNADCDIQFGSEISSKSQPISFQVTFPVYAAFAMNSAEQQQRKIVHVPGMEGFDIVIDHAVRELVVIVESASDLFIEGGIRLAIFDEHGTRQNRVEPAAYKNLSVEARRITWRTSYPRLEYKYEFGWQIPNTDDVIGAPSVNQALALRDFLARSMSGDDATRLRESLSPLLQQFRNEFKQQFGSFDFGEVIDISVMAFDDQREGKLRVIAGLFPSESTVWNWPGFSPGFGVAGRAFKSNLPVYYFRNARAGSARDVYISPDEPLASGMGLVKHEILISAPLHLLGDSRHHIVAVLNVGSSSPGSRLYDLIASSEAERVQVKEKLNAWIQAVENTLVPLLLELAASSARG